MNYISDLGYKPRLLLVEDNKNIRKYFEKRLKRAGFRVVARDDGNKISKLLKGKRIKFDVVLSDSDMPRMQGYEAVKMALDSRLLNQDVIILGMSDCEDNCEYWKRIAHNNGFFNKNRYCLGNKDIGQAVMSHYWNFVRSGDIWKMRML